MAIQYSVAVNNARLNAIETTIGTSPKLRILTGSPPANCAASETGSLLAELTLPSDFMANAASAQKAKSGTWSGTVTGAGTAGYFRLVDSAGTTCHMQGTCGLGTGDMPMDNNVLAVGQTLVVNTATITAGNQ